MNRDFGPDLSRQDGEPDGSRTLAARFREELGWLAVVPQQGEQVVLS